MLYLERGDRVLTYSQYFIMEALCIFLREDTKQETLNRKLVKAILTKKP